MSFVQIDKALNRYYQSLGHSNYTNDQGTGKFLEFCYENEADPDDINDELEDFENCMYLEFDENFPFNQQYQNKDHITKQKFIFNLIKQCYQNPNISFTSQTKTKTKTKTQNNNNNKLAIDDSKQPPLKRERTVITEPKILATCDAISRYYKSIRKEYNQLFSIYCHENGIDDKELDFELQQDINDCNVIEFDENFPFTHGLSHANRREREEFLFDFLNDCYNNPNRMFNPTIPQCLLSTATLKYLYTITEKEYCETKQLYSSQCPTLWNSGMEGDKGFTYFISIGRKYNFNYLQYLVDDYHRARITHINKSYTIEDWSKNHSHFIQLKKIKFKPPWKREEEELKSKNKVKNVSISVVPRNAYDLAIGAIRSYESRCIPRLQFKNLRTINDSLEIIIRYIDAAIGFVRGRIDASNNRRMPICPFQIDFCISFGEPQLEESFVCSSFDNDDDDDDNSQQKIDEKEIFVDAIGNIEKKLIVNGLKYKKGKQTPERLLDFEFMSKRGLSTIFKEFIEKNKLLKDKGGRTHPEVYLHNKRLIIFVDRRHKTGKEQKVEKDNIWLYEPPMNCMNIPHNAVPEWHVSASKTCLLPNMEYGDGKEAENQAKIVPADEEDEDENVKNETDIEKIKNANISSSFHCKGALMTLSFIAYETDSIRCYLYWNGQMTRFMPQDCKTVLPEIFNMRWNNGMDVKENEKSVNEMFLEFKDSNQFEPNDIDSIIKRMKSNMRDVYFDNNICLRNR